MSTPKSIVIMTMSWLVFASPCLWGQDAATPPPYELLLNPSLTGGLILPVGAFSGISSLGGGAELGLEMRNLFFRQSALKLSINYNFISQTIDYVSSFGHSSLALLAGYSFNLADGFTCTPLVGGGYICHFVTESSLLTFFDPQLRFETDFHIGLFKDFYLYLAPVFTFFFEQSNTGMFFAVNLGVSTSFHIPLPRAATVGPHNTVLLTNELAAFSPNGDGIKDTVRLVPRVTGKFESFELRIMERGKPAVKTIQGGSTLPPQWTWNGKRDDGKQANDGVYLAELVLFSSGKENAAASGPITLDTKPLEATLTVNPKTVSPNGDGVNDTVLISVSSKEATAVVDWSLRIIDPAGNLFREKKGAAVRQIDFRWDGRSATGELVQSGEEYRVEARLADAAGNIRLLKDTIDSDFIVQKFGNKLKVVVPSIVFEGNAADYRVGKPEQVAKNLEVLNRLADIFRAYPAYTLVIEGYAINVYTEDPQRMEKENREALLPLSLKRAELIREALIERGLDGAKIKAVGRGNADPVVPYGDKANQWKNRRVEFILEKQ
jgi:outer membrane protein OmpA-like peptidoglycan-associated protein